MPNRIIREGILTSERVNALDAPAEVFYRRLMSVVDDFGRYFAHPKILRAALYPLQIDTVGEADVVKWLDTCVKAQLIQCYTHEKKWFLEVLDFNQRVQIKHSKFPPSVSAIPSVNGVSPSVTVNHAQALTHHSSLPSVTVSHGTSPCLTVLSGDLSPPDDPKTDGQKLGNSYPQDISDDSQPTHLTGSPYLTVSHGDSPLESKTETETESKSLGVSNARTYTHARDGTPSPHDHNDQYHLSGISAAGEICLALKNEGLVDVSPTHPTLLQLLASGVTLDTFIAAARLAKAKKKGFAYALGIVNTRLADAAGFEKSTYPIHPSSTKRKIRDANHDQHAVIEPA